MYGRRTTAAPQRPPGRRTAELERQGEALREAQRSRPEDDRVHPKVGVVVVKDGQILASGHRAEGRHAEYEVLENDLKDEQIAGATVYTTLEPCTERNPPKIACVDRLIARNVGRVVVGMLDPNPKIRGQGIRELEHVRIKVDRFHEDIRLAVEELNRDFIREYDEKRRAAVVDHAPNRDAAEDEEEDRERQAMRAFLQRAEVRLSTMHRVAGAFLSGAGLLFLLPVLFRDYPRELALAILSSFARMGWLGLAATLLLLSLVAGTIGVSLYSLYLLVKDIVLFYFIGQCPGFAEDLFYPRFALTAIAFSPDESLRIKDQIIQEQRQADLMSFALPRSAEALDINIGAWDKLGSSIYSPSRPLQDGDSELHRHFRLLLGQAGLVDRDLVSEVARMEVSVVRHNVHLRRLVLRYAKSLLLMIWTIVVMFATILAVQVLKPVPFLVQWQWVAPVIAIGVWLTATPRIVRLPIEWIYEWANRNASRTRNVASDPALTLFERNIGKACAFGWLLLLVAAGTAAMATFLQA